MAVIYHGGLANLNPAKYWGLVDGYAKQKENIMRENVTDMVESAVYAKDNWLIKESLA